MLTTFWIKKKFKIDLLVHVLVYNLKYNFPIKCWEKSWEKILRWIKTQLLTLTHYFECTWIIKLKTFTCNSSLLGLNKSKQLIPWCCLPHNSTVKEKGIWNMKKRFYQDFDAPVEITNPFLKKNYALLFESLPCSQIWCHQLCSWWAGVKFRICTCTLYSETTEPLISTSPGCYLALSWAVWILYLQNYR